MDRKTVIEKNVLDLEYQKHAQILNALLILMTTGLLSFLGTFLWKRELMLQGLFIAAFIAAICYLIYKNVDNNLKKILEKIEQLN